MGDSILAEVDRLTLAANFACFGFPLLAFSCLSFYALYRTDFMPRFMPSFLVQRHNKYRWGQNAEVFQRLLPVFITGNVIVILQPLIILCTWAGVAFHNINHPLGITILCLGLLLFLITFAFFHWRFSAWQQGVFPVRIAFSLAGLVLVSLGVYMRLELTYSFEFSAIAFLTASTLPVIRIVYELAQHGHSHEVTDYQAILHDGHDKFIRFYENESGLDPDRVPHLASALLAAHTKLKGAWDRTRVRTSILYACSFVILLGYGFDTWQQNPDDVQSLGFVTMAALLILDATSFLSVFAGLLHSPLSACVLILCFRVVIVLASSTQWFLGHCLIYVVIAIYFLITFLARFAPLQPHSPASLLKHQFQSQINIDQLLDREKSPGSSDTNNSNNNNDIQFVKMGAFFRSRFGQQAHVYGDLLSFFTLTIALCAEMSAVYASEWSSHGPFGIVAMALVTFAGLSFSLFRYYQNGNYELTAPLFAAALGVYAVCLSLGGIVWGVAENFEFFFVCSAFLPPLAMTMTVVCVTWRRNDYSIGLSPRHHAVPYAPFWAMFWTGGLPLQTYLLGIGVIFCFVITLSFGHVLSQTLSNAWGWSVACWMIILPSTIIPGVEWFNSFSVSFNMIVQLTAAFVTHVVFCVIYFVVELNTEASSSSALFVLLLFLGYPTLVLSTTALVMLVDEKWVTTPLLKKAFSVAGLSIFVLLVMTTVLLKPSYIGATGLVLFGSMLLAGILPILRKMCFAWSSELSRLFWVMIWVIIVIYTLLSALAYGFLGFSIGWFSGIVCLVVLGYKQYRKVWQGHRFYLYSQVIFPVYLYTSSSASSLTEHNTHVFLVLLLFALTFLWGVLAMFFTSPHVGFGVAACAVFATQLFAHELMLRPLKRLRRAVEQIGGHNLAGIMATATKQAAKVELKVHKKAAPGNTHSTKQAHFTQKRAHSKEGNNSDGDGGDTFNVEVTSRPLPFLPLNVGPSSMPRPSSPISPSHRPTIGLLPSPQASAFTGLSMVRPTHTEKLQHLVRHPSLKLTPKEHVSPLACSPPQLPPLQPRTLMRRQSIPLSRQGSIVSTFSTGTNKFMHIPPTRAYTGISYSTQYATAISSVDTFDDVEGDEDSDDEDLHIIKVGNLATPDGVVAWMEQRAKVEGLRSMLFSSSTSCFQYRDSKLHVPALTFLEDGVEHTISHPQALALLLLWQRRLIALFRTQFKYELRVRVNVLFAAKRLVAEKQRIAEAFVRSQEIKELRGHQRGPDEDLLKTSELHRRAVEFVKQRRKHEDETKRKRAQEELANRRRLAALEVEEAARLEKKRLAADAALRHQHEQAAAMRREALVRMEQQRTEDAKQLDRLLISQRQQQRQQEEEEEEKKAHKEEVVQRERENILAAQRAIKVARDREHAELVDHALQSVVCTREMIGTELVHQPYFLCFTCTAGEATPMEVCAICIVTCHSRHEYVAGEDSNRLVLCSCQHLCAEEDGQEQQQQQQRQRTDKEEEKEDKLSMISLVVEGSAYAAALDACQRQNKLYCDPDFPPAHSSLFGKEYARQGLKPRRAWRNLTWKRLSEITGGDIAPCLFQRPVEANNIKQGLVGDCWLLSAFSVMTLRHDKKRNTLLDAFVSRHINPYGLYSIRLFKNGRPVELLIDDYFPCTASFVRTPDGPRRHFTPAFARSLNAHEYWVMLLEKAFAKLYGSYEHIECGFVDQALVDLTGGIASRFDLTSEDPSVHNGALFQTLLAYNRAGFLMGAGSPAGSDAEDSVSKWGIVQGHAYSVLDVQEVDGYQLLRLRNPWARKEWTGDWSDKSSLWTKRMKKKLDYQNKDDGIFWMAFGDFVVHFEDVYVCRFFDEDAWYSLPLIQSEWKDVTAGGCTNFDACVGSPQYFLSARQEETTVVISLAQDDPRGTGEELFAIAIEVYANKGRRVTATKMGHMIATNPDGYIFRREVTAEFTISPSKHPFTVLMSPFNQGEERGFTCSVHSDASIDFEEAPLPPSIFAAIAAAANPGIAMGLPVSKSLCEYETTQQWGIARAKTFSHTIAGAAAINI